MSSQVHVTRELDSTIKSAAAFVVLCRRASLIKEEDDAPAQQAHLMRLVDSSLRTPPLSTGTGPLIHLQSMMRMAVSTALTKPNSNPISNSNPNRLMLDGLARHLAALLRDSGRDETTVIDFLIRDILESPLLLYTKPQTSLAGSFSILPSHQWQWAEKCMALSTVLHRIAFVDSCNNNTLSYSLLTYLCRTLHHLYHHGCTVLFLNTHQCRLALTPTHETIDPGLQTPSSPPPMLYNPLPNTKHHEPLGDSTHHDLQNTTLPSSMDLVNVITVQWLLLLESISMLRLQHVPQHMRPQLLLRDILSQMTSILGSEMITPLSLSQAPLFFIQQQKLNSNSNIQPYTNYCDSQNDNPLPSDTCKPKRSWMDPSLLTNNTLGNEALDTSTNKATSRILLIMTPPSKLMTRLFLYDLIQKLSTLYLQG